MTMTNKRRRESKLLLELQRDHGYMLAAMPRERDRQTTQVRKVGTARMTMVPAQVVRLIVPDDSSLGIALTASEQHKRKMSARRKGRP